MNKKACILLVTALMAPIAPAKAQTDDLFERTILVFSGAAELLECNSPHLAIAYENCNNYWNYVTVGDRYAHVDTNYSITIDTKESLPCVYNKYVADPTDGDLLWQSYLVACGVQNNIAPTSIWEFNGTAISDAAIEAGADYNFAQEMLTLPLQIKIKNRKIYYYQNPLLAEVRLQKKVRGHWRTRYDRIVGDLVGQEEKLTRGYYRLTITRFDGKIVYNKRFRIR